MGSSLITDPERVMDSKAIVSYFGAMWTRAYDQQFLRTQKLYIVAKKLEGVKLGEFDQHLRAYLADPMASFCKHSFLYFISRYNSYAKSRKMAPTGDPYADD